MCSAYTLQYPILYSQRLHGLPVTEHRDPYYTLAGPFIPVEIIDPWPLTNFL